MVDTDQMGRILVICTGNVCRSPYVQYWLQQMLDEAWGPGAFAVRSAGLRAMAGQPMDRRSEAAIRELGMDPSAFVSKELPVGLVPGADLILTLTRRQRSEFVQRYPQALPRTFGLVDFVHLSGFVPEDDMPSAEVGREWLTEAVAAVGRRLGLQSPIPSEVADIDDPYGREDAIFDTMIEKVATLEPGMRRILGCD